MSYDVIELSQQFICHLLNNLNWAEDVAAVLAIDLPMDVGRVQISETHISVSPEKKFTELIKRRF